METSLSDRLQTHSMIFLIYMFVFTARMCDGSTAMDCDIGRLLSSVRTLCFRSFDSNLEGSKVCINVITVYSLGLFLPLNLNFL